MKRSQSNRQANFKSSLDPDALMLNSMLAREQVSGLFEYELTVVSEDENIDLYQILGEHARVEFELPGGGMRYFSGHVAEFSFASFRDNLAEYRIVLRPWLWLLTRASNNRIFQGKTVPDIIKQVCQDHGFTDIDSRLSGQYAERVFCVQYNETDFDFLSRLMEEEGIYYFFEHEEGKHTVVLADAPNAHETFGKYDVVPWYPPDAHDHREREHLDDWSMARGVRSGKFTQRDYDFTKPGANLEVVSRIAKPHAQAEFEQYQYPGGYSEVQKGEAIARNRLEADQADHEVLQGRGNARGMLPGFLFTLELFPRDDQNREYLITHVTHRLHQGGYDSGGADSSDDFEYGCSLQAMPSSEPYRPPRTTPRPVVHGPQTAIVVGESGEEIWTNEHGQVKVQFHWDRDGKNDQDSSCWVRVSQAWAGKQWGAQFLPRIGHEVIVEFLEGDPDRPIITGSVYNAENKPPYELPGNATQSGVKTRSSKSGTRDNFNEIRFEDKKGSEQLYMHAEKNLDTRVEHCQTLNVDVNRSVTVGNDEKHHVKNNREKNVDVDETTMIGKNRESTIGLNEKLTVGIERTKTIGTSEKNTIGTTRSTTVGVSDTLNVTGNFSATAGAMFAMKAGAVMSLDAGGAMTLKAAGPISISSAAGVSIMHNPHADTGMIRTVIDQLNEDISQMKKSFKVLSLSNTVLGQSITQLSNSVTAVDISHKDVSMGTTYTDISQKVFGLEKGQLKMML
ncbi:MAG TPA: type VI secretion system tip protein TssI/VgrG [Wenzhouxiangellaceae bacterium]|nr:type VI secretion system tip protein TssI/VgrG [Wenzhouxiangellaceae bacterium]